GSLGVPYARFALYDALGTLLWGGLAVVLGAVFHRAVDRVLLALQALGARASPSSAGWRASRPPSSAPSWAAARARSSSTRGANARASSTRGASRARS